MELKSAFTRCKKEHNPPHLHAMYGEFDAEIDIRSGRQIRGNLPGTALSLVDRWLDIHRNELMAMWTTQEFRQLPPLE